MQDSLSVLYPMRELLIFIFKCAVASLFLVFDPTLR